MFAGIHLNHEVKDFVGVADQNSNGLAQFLMFVEGASEGDDARRWFTWSHESFLELGIIYRENLAPCCS